MSGIYGYVGDTALDREAARAMGAALAHRGGDDRGTHRAPGVTLGCRRLAVIDARGGRQPIGNESGTVQVVHDGAIYNHRTLREELRGAGHRFRTRSDAEVIVHLYEELGTGCVERLRGMFAFALWDGERRRLVLARDHLGQKPLFYADDRRGLLFASEVKALAAARPELRELDPVGLHHFLSLRFVPPPRTMLDGVRKLAPAHVLVVENGSHRLRRFWRPSFEEKLEMPDERFVAGAREKLEEAVRVHLAGDVRVGAFLSGGLDSSLIVAMMAKAVEGSFPTFSVGVDDEEFNELPYAREVSGRFGTEQVETWARPDVITDLPRVVWHLDEPSDPVAASKFVGSRAAAERVKVVLGGDGGDELFAGFDRYRGVRLVDWYARVPRLLRRVVVGSLVRLLPPGFGYGGLGKKLRWLESVAEAEDVADRFGAAVAFFRFDRARKRALWCEELRDALEGVDSGEIVAGAVRGSDATNPIERMLHADYLLRLPEHSLMLTDRLGMAHGLEVRSPMVDRELVEYLAAFPLRMKVRRLESKYVERMVGELELPSRIARREKRGFRFPLSAWFQGELHGALRTLLYDAELIRARLFRREMVAELLDEHRDRRVDHGVRLWMLLNLEIWHRLMIGGESPEDVEEWVRAAL